MKTSKLHTVLQKSLRIIVLLFALLLGENLAYGQAKLLIPNGNSDKDEDGKQAGGQWKPDGKINCDYLKPRFSYLCGGNSGSSKYMISFQRVTKEEGETEIAKGQGVGWNYRTCLSVSKDKNWMTNNPSEDYIDDDYPDIVYAYSVGSKEEGFNVYYYVSDDKSPTPTNNDDNIKPLLVGDAQNLFQNGDIKSPDPPIRGSRNPLLETLDLSGWDFSGVNSLARFFSNAKRLTNVTFGSTVDLSNLINAHQMFNGCDTYSSTMILDLISTWIVDSKYDENERKFVANEIFEKREMFTANGGKTIVNNTNVETANSSIFYTKSNSWLLRSNEPSYNFDVKVREALAEESEGKLTVKWDVVYENLISSFSIEYSIDGGNTYTHIADVQANSQDTAAYMLSSYEYEWTTIPASFRGNNLLRIKITSMSDEITISEPFPACYLLPIELSYFTLSQDGKDLFFEWETATETNNDYFTIEQSIDGISFHEVARISGAGTTSLSNSYEYSLPATFSGLMYFRLKQTDYNGDYSYSDVQTIFVDNGEYIRLYPTIATDFITIEGDYESVKFSNEQGKIHHPTRMHGNSYPIAALPQGMHYAIISLKNGEIVTRQFFRK